MIRPASGAHRASGSERRRSNTPFVRSVLRPRPTYIVTNSMFITMIPGRANVRYSPVDPAMAPPNT